MFHVDNGAGRFTAVYDAGIPGHLCDGQWHKVTANKIKHRIELTVDGKQVEAQSPNQASTSADTNDPVFVGGFPGEPYLLHKNFFVVSVFKFICITMSMNVCISTLPSFNIYSHK